MTDYAISVTSKKNRILSKQQIDTIFENKKSQEFIELCKTSLRDACNMHESIKVFKHIEYVDAPFSNNKKGQK